MLRDVLDGARKLLKRALMSSWLAEDGHSMERSSYVEAEAKVVLRSAVVNRSSKLIRMSSDSKSGRSWRASCSCISL